MQCGHVCHAVACTLLWAGRGGGQQHVVFLIFFVLSLEEVVSFRKYEIKTESWRCKGYRLKED